MCVRFIHLKPSDLTKQDTNKYNKIGEFKRQENEISVFMMAPSLALFEKATNSTT